MPSLRLIATMLLALALLAPRGSAQDKKPPAKEINADLSFVNATGNTSVTTVSANEKFIRRLTRWEFTQDLGTVYGRTDGEETANLWRASLRGDYSLSRRWALYARTAFDRDRFAGITSRFAEGIGAVARLIATDINQLNLEGGFELTQQDNIDGTSDDFASLRGAANWKHWFTKTAYFFQGVEVLPNLDDSDDLRVNSETTLVAPLSTHVAMKLSYIVRFDNQPALNAARTAPLRKSDRILSSGIQITF